MGKCGIVTPICRFTSQGLFDTKFLKTLKSGMICNREMNIFLTKTKKACCRPRGQVALYNLIYSVNLMIEELAKSLKTKPTAANLIKMLANQRNILIAAAPSVKVKLVLKP